MATVAFVMDELFEDSEFFVPIEKLREAGHQSVVVGLREGKKLTGKKGGTATVDKAIDQVSAEQFDALVVPGGYSPDKIRGNPEMVELTRAMWESGKPVAAICHGGWMLAEADVVKDKTVTSWPSIKTDLINAGARWVDQELVEDGNLITSRKPDDLESFSEAIVAQLEQRA